jgi:hypothetical protein
MFPVIRFKGIRKVFKDFREKFDVDLKDSLVCITRKNQENCEIFFGKVELKIMEIWEIRKVVEGLNGKSELKRINMNLLVENNQNSSVIHRIRNFEDLDVDLIEFLEGSLEVEEEIKLEKVGLNDLNIEEKPKIFKEFFKNVEEKFFYSFKSFDEIFDEKFYFEEEVELFQIDDLKIEFEPTELKNFNRREVLDFSLICDPMVSTIKDIRLPIKPDQNSIKDNSIQNKIIIDKSCLNQIRIKNENSNIFNDSTEKPFSLNRKKNISTSPDHLRNKTCLENPKTCLENQTNFSSPVKNTLKLKINNENLNLIKRETFTESQFEQHKKNDFTKKGILKTTSQDKTSNDKPKEFNGLKLTFINCSEDLKNSSKILSFSEKNQLTTYSKPENFVQNPKILVKIYIDINCSLSRKIINSLNMQRLNIIGLEIHSDLMDSVDMILTWQTAVKFIFNRRIENYKTIKAYINTFHEKLVLFDSVLLVYVHSRESYDENTQKYLEMYSESLRSSKIYCILIKITEIREISNFLNRSLSDYIDSIKDVDTWNKVQEEISDVMLSTKDSSTNIYSFNVLMACNSNPSLNFTKVSNCLGLSTHQKFLQMEKILKMTKNSK